MSVRGHIIDSLILAKILDLIVSSGDNYEIESLDVGKGPENISAAVLNIDAADEESLGNLLDKLHPHGVELMDEPDAQFLECDADGVAPSGFYVTTGLPTQVRTNSTWSKSFQTSAFQTVVLSDNRPLPIDPTEITTGDAVLVGTGGVRVKATRRRVQSAWSTTPTALRDVADLIKTQRKNSSSRCVALVGCCAPHGQDWTGLDRLVRGGFVDSIIVNNSFAVNDLVVALTGAGVDATDDEQRSIDALRVCNAVRPAGSIAKAVASGLITHGVLHACSARGIPMVIAGSVSDTSVLPETINDASVVRDSIHKALSEATLVLALEPELMTNSLRSVSSADSSLVIVDPQDSSAPTIPPYTSIGIQAGLFASLLADEL